MGCIFGGGGELLTKLKTDQIRNMTTNRWWYYIVEFIYLYIFDIDNDDLVNIIIVVILSSFKYCI